MSSYFDYRAATDDDADMNDDDGHEIVACQRCSGQFHLSEIYHFEFSCRSVCFECVQDEIDEQSRYLESCKHALLACLGYVGGASFLGRAGIEATIREALAPLWDGGGGIRPKGTSQ